MDSRRLYSQNQFQIPPPLFHFSSYEICLLHKSVGGCIGYIEKGEINGKFIFIMKLLCKQVQNHRGRGQEDKRSECDLASQSEASMPGLDQSEAAIGAGDDL